MQPGNSVKPKAEQGGEECHTSMSYKQYCSRNCEWHVCVEREGLANTEKLSSTLLSHKMGVLFLGHLAHSSWFLVAASGGPQASASQGLQRPRKTKSITSAQSKEWSRGDLREATLRCPALRAIWQSQNRAGALPTLPLEIGKTWNGMRSYPPLCTGKGGSFLNLGATLVFVSEWDW